MQFFEFINNYRGSKFLINYFKTLKEPAILMNGQFCGPITQSFSKKLRFIYQNQDHGHEP